jgi:acyl-coenzyme A thioesterase PaaI-like protein
MSLTNRLQSTAQIAIEQARDAGLPVERAEQAFSDTIRPRLVQMLSPLVIPFVRRSGVRLTELEPGRVVARMPLKGNVNHIGTMYAGALFTLAEFPGGPLLLATYGMSRFIPIVTDLRMEYVKAAKGPVTIELTLTPDEIERIEAETLATGKAEFELRGELKNRQGEVVARSVALYQMRPKRR